MFWWRKRSEGFEWRDYVRTTILVRREERRQRIKDAQGAAAAHVKDAGRRGVEAAVVGGRAAAAGSVSWSKRAAALLADGARWTGRAALRALAATARGLASATAGLASAIAALFATLARGAASPLHPVLEPVLETVRRPKINLSLTAVAVLAGLGALYRTWAFGFDGDAAVATLAAVIAGLLVALAALTNPERTPRGNGIFARLNDYDVLFPGGQRVSLLPAALALVVLVGISAGAVAAIGHWASSWPAGTEAQDEVASSGAIPLPRQKSAALSDGTLTTRRARAITGDTLRIGSTLVAIDGVEAPEIGQVCERDDGEWPCGRAARDALDRMVRGRSVSCQITGEREARLKTAVCATGEADLADKLIEDGMAFSTSFFFWTHHAGLERKARAEKKGLWAGDPEHPQAWREKRWAEAKQNAPDGCPIKGRIRSGARTYILPWSADYGRVKLSTARGERWFCSESEAEAAGWRPATPS